MMTTTATKKTITYFYRGPIERGSGNGYTWRNGYSEDSSEGHPYYPWSTRRECQREAKRQGALAVFVHDKAKQIA
jgi:hypothetical protein